MANRRIRRVAAAIALTTAGVLMTVARADLLIEHVNVISMIPQQAVQPDVHVLIRGERIVSITREAPQNLPAGIERIEARDQWLMPGLADMHVHLESDRLMRLYLNDPNVPRGTIRSADALLPYVANGVLQIAVLSSTPETIAQRDEVELGHVLGPHIALAAMIDGVPPVWPVGMTRSAANASDGRQAVRDAAAEGYEFIKAYENLDLDTLVAICDEAHKLGMKVIGHLPNKAKGQTEKLFVPGLAMVAHAEEFAQQTSPPDAAQIPKYIRWARDNGTWLTSTLTVDERIAQMMMHPESLRQRSELQYLPPQIRTMVIEENRYVKGANPGWIEHTQRIIEFNRKLIVAFAAAGIPIVAGTDAQVPGVVPGFSLQDELQSLAQAGLSNEQVLESATRLPAQWLGTLEDRGTVAAGKRADLLLLEKNPLEQIENTRAITAVIVSGKAYSRSELDRRMAELRQRNAVEH
jgi:hypothetical protein